VLSIEFHTDDPLGHASRAMDVVRRMGLSLLAMCATGEAEGFRISIFCAAAEGAHTLVQRIANIPGVADVTVTVEPAPR
jgi:hypothetical protein